MKFILKTFAIIIAVFSLLQCRNDSQENTRAYVEGKVAYNNIDLYKYRIRIIADHTIVAETAIEANGNFKLSGPINNDGFTIHSAEKITSFDVDRNGLILSTDGLSIAVPAGITYLKFHHITLEKWNFL